jgi:integrase
MLWREVAGWPRGCSRTRSWRRCGSCDCARRRPPRCRRCPATTGTWAAIGKLLLYTGLRIEEVEALDLDDIVISARRGKVIVRDGKGGVYRERPLHRAARTALRAWLDERPQPAQPRRRPPPQPRPLHRRPDQARTRPTRPRLPRPPHHRRLHPPRDHPRPQALHQPRTLPAPHGHPATPDHHLTLIEASQ